MNKRMDKKCCGNCRFWSNSFVVNKRGYSDCSREESLNSLFFIEATASDDSGLQAYLMTNESFYCSQWEEKQEETDTDEDED